MCRPAASCRTWSWRHRRRARAEDRLCKDTGLTNLPLHGFAQNQIRCALVMLAVELTAWMQLLALHHPARRWEPKRLRYRLFAVPAALARTGRRVLLHLAPSPRGPGSSPTPSPDSVRWPSPADRDPSRPKNPPHPGTVEAALTETTSGGVLIGVVAEYGADLIADKFPPNLACQPILS